LCHGHHHLVHEGGWTVSYDSTTDTVTFTNPDDRATSVSAVDSDPILVGAHSR
jgi:hypothetical protein